MEGWGISQIWVQASEGQPWNWHISFCGDIDIVGKQKAQSFYRTVLW